jgi:hypothetical protein
LASPFKISSFSCLWFQPSHTSKRIITILSWNLSASYECTLIWNYSRSASDFLDSLYKVWDMMQLNINCVCSVCLSVCRRPRFHIEL